MGKVVVPTEFRERIRRELSAEDVAELKCYTATSPLGHKLVFLPLIKKWGAEVVYQPRLHLKGVSGPLRVSKEAVIGAGFDESVADKARIFCQELNAYYSPLLKAAEGFEQAKQLAEGVETEAEVEGEV